MSPLPYRPHPLLRNGHLQTLLVGVLGGERPPYRARPIVIQLADGESLVVHEELGPPLASEAPLVVLIHGLGGDHRSGYLERLAPELRAAGFAVWRLDLRGCGEGLKYAWKPANAGSSDDLAQVIRAASESYPQKPIHVVGFSLSGNIVLKMLGETAANCHRTPIDLARIASAIAIAPPVDLHACASNMERASRRVYTRYYLKVLDSQVKLRRRQWPAWRAIPESPAIKTIRQFDARYTAPLSGFASTDDYYSQSSAGPWLRHISSRTAILVDRHDPIVTAESFANFVLSDAIELIDTHHGGHMGYFGIDAQGQLLRWMEYFVLQRLRTERA